MMRLLAAGSILFFTLFLGSCEKCMKCSFTYTITTIQQGVNGEEEVVTTYTGYVKDTDSTFFQDECIKGEADFTIDDAYKAFADTTTLDNFAYTCTEL